ncbi:MAG: hypothetical protein JXX28_07680 [Deltaproteobacteria bacterium]|nr:hypothetical protein [Deltaproteobacteria bacterium]
MRLLPLALLAACAAPGQDRFLTAGPASVTSVENAVSVPATRFLLPPLTGEPLSEQLHARCARGEDISRRVPLGWAALELLPSRARFAQREVLQMDAGVLPEDLAPLREALVAARQAADRAAQRGCTPWSPAAHAPPRGDLLVVADGGLPYATVARALALAAEEGFGRPYLLVRDPSPTRGAPERTPPVGVPLRIGVGRDGLALGEQVRLPCEGACAGDSYDLQGLGAAIAESGEGAVLLAPEGGVPMSAVVGLLDLAEGRGLAVALEPTAASAAIPTGLLSGSTLVPLQTEQGIPVLPLHLSEGHAARR